MRVAYMAVCSAKNVDDGFMVHGKTYTPEQLHRIYNAHVRVCAMRDVSLVSPQGKQIAKRLLDEFTGSEPEDDIVRKFLS